jgi:hypothetical protein
MWTIAALITPSKLGFKRVGNDQPAAGHRSVGPYHCGGKQRGKPVEQMADSQDQDDG